MEENDSSIKTLVIQILNSSKNPPPDIFDIGDFFVIFMCDVPR